MPESFNLKGGCLTVKTSKLLPPQLQQDILKYLVKQPEKPEH